jgi:hypothetical protein
VALDWLRGAPRCLRAVTSGRRSDNRNSRSRSTPCPTVGGNHRGSRARLYLDTRLLQLAGTLGLDAWRLGRPATPARRLEGGSLGPARPWLCVGWGPLALKTPPRNSEENLRFLIRLFRRRPFRRL